MSEQDNDVTQERWYKDPFGWYEEEKFPELLGVQMTDTVALDFLAGLYDIHNSFKKHGAEKAIHHTEVLATLLIASSKHVGAEVIDELIAKEFNDMDFDEALAKFMEDNNDAQ